MKIKKEIARVLGLILSLALFFNVMPINVLADDEDEELTDKLESRVEHTDKNFEEFTLYDVDEAGFKATYAGIEDLYNDSANSDEVLEIIYETEKYYNYVSCNVSYLSILTSIDTTDDESSDEYKKQYELAINMGDELLCLYHDVALSECSDAFKEYVDNDDDWQEILEYEPLTDEQKELKLKEKDLELEYDDIINSEDYFYTYNGVDYTFDSIVTAYDAGEIPDVDFFYGMADIFQQLNKALGDLYIELVEIRTELARSYGYDNYADYAYEKSYDRDYTEDDIVKFKDQVKEYFKPLADELTTLKQNYRSDYSAVDASSMTVNEVYDFVRNNLSDVSTDMLESFDYMLDHNLCNMEQSDVKAPTSFTITLGGDYNAPFIEADASGNASDVDTLIHEFGHYNEAYFGSKDEWLYGALDLDLAEIHSQGLELIYEKYLDSVYGEYTDAMRAKKYDRFVYATIQGCKEDEFQYRVYSDPDNLTVSKLNQIYYDVCMEYENPENTYSYYFSEYMGITPKGEFMEWMLIPHTFQSPMYYISYAISMGAVLELQDEIISDRDTGVTKYLQLVHFGFTFAFQETLDKVDLNNPITNPRFDVYAENIREVVGLSSQNPNITSPTAAPTAAPTATPDSKVDKEPVDESGNGLSVVQIIFIITLIVFSIATVVIILCIIISKRQKKKVDKEQAILGEVNSLNGIGQNEDSPVNPFISEENFEYVEPAKKIELDKIDYDPNAIINTYSPYTSNNYGGMQQGYNGQQMQQMGMQPGYNGQQMQQMGMQPGYNGQQMQQMGMQQGYNGQQMQAQTGMQSGYNGQQMQQMGMQSGYNGQQMQAQTGMQPGYNGQQMQAQTGMQQGFNGQQMQTQSGMQSDLGAQQMNTQIQENVQANVQQTYGMPINQQTNGMGINQNLNEN